MFNGRQRKKGGKPSGKLIFAFTPNWQPKHNQSEREKRIEAFISAAIVKQSIKNKNAKSKYLKHLFFVLFECHSRNFFVLLSRLERCLSHGVNH